MASKGRAKTKIQCNKGRCCVVDIATGEEKRCFTRKRRKPRKWTKPE